MLPVPYICTLINRVGPFALDVVLNKLHLLNVSLHYLVIPMQAWKRRRYYRKSILRFYNWMKGHKSH